MGYYSCDSEQVSSRGEIYPFSAASGNDISVVPKVGGSFLYLFSERVGVSR